MIIRAILDIDPSDQTVRELSDLAFNFGLIDMTEVLILSRANQNLDQQLLTDTTDFESFTKLIQLVLGCAIVNFACWKFESYGIELPATTKERTAFQFFRIYPQDMHRVLGEKYLARAREIMANYGKSEGYIIPAE